MNKILTEIHNSSKGFEDSDFLPNVLGKYYHEAALGHIPVVLFGAGSAGVHLCNAMEIYNFQISCFCDNNPEIIGDHRVGHPVISVEELRRDHMESLIVIAVSQPFAHKIREQLSLLGFSSDMIHIPEPDPLLYYTNAINLYWPSEDLRFYADHLQKTYDLLYDQKSKDLLVQRIALLSGGFDYCAFKKFVNAYADLISDAGPGFFTNPRYDEDHFYFHSDFFPLKNGEVFANVGALVGDCAVDFVTACEAKGIRYREIVNFEPDPGNFLQLSVNMSHLTNVKCLPYGLWSQRSTLRFSNQGAFRAGTPGCVDENGNLMVEVVSLDEALPDAEISFIKMDVEGAEIQALRGAADMIRRTQPKLAISAYHKRNDIFEIPLLIHQIHPGYKYYLRHHSTTFGETVLFAV
jgi:FkbM family methyltransferase